MRHKIKHRIEFLNDINEGEFTVSELRLKYNISRATYYRWIASANQIRLELESCKKDRKVTWFKNKYQLKGAGKKPTLSSDDENLLFNWFREQRKNGIAISNKMLKTKAKELKPESRFKASNGWLRLFKKRHNIVMRAVTCKNQIEVLEKKNLKNYS